MEIKVLVLCMTNYSLFDEQYLVMRGLAAMIRSGLDSQQQQHTMINRRRTAEITQKQER